jgi:perosamine synthetase
MNKVSQKVLDSLKKLSNEKDFIPLHEPIFHGNEKKYVSECIETGWVSSVGSYVDLFEQKLAEYLNVKEVVVAVNGTSAIHAALHAIGVDSSCEVLIPSLTFVATANAVSYTGATPHLVDSNLENLGLCPDLLEEHLLEIADLNDSRNCINKNTGKIIKAIIPMHCLGLPVNMDRLKEVCEKYNITIVEDAAESLGSFYKGKATGGIGKVGAISFNGNKIITCGGGGALATNDEELGKRLKHITTTAKSSKEGFFFHDEIGFNYRMPNLNAALGCAQLEKLDEYIEVKRNLAQEYKNLFSDIDGVGFVEEQKDTKSNYWLCAIRVKDKSQLDEIIEITNKNNVMTRPLWTPMHKLPMYENCPKSGMYNADNLEETIICLPSSVNLKIN